MKVCLGCPPGTKISSIDDAQFGTLAGDCSTSSPFHTSGTCAADPATVLAVARDKCMGEANCTIPADFKLFGTDPCPGTFKELGVRVSCS
jgi:hypothetical protein